MNIYLVYNPENKGYFLLRFNHLVDWAEQQEATVYTRRVHAYRCGEFAFNYGEGCDKKFEVVRLVAEQDSHPETKDGKKIQLGEWYHHPVKTTIFSVRIVEILHRWSLARSGVYIKTDLGDWVRPHDLFKSGTAARAAWKEAQ